MNTATKKWAITISPPMRHTFDRFVSPNRFQYMEDRLHIDTIFKYNRIGRYIIWPEFDKRGRLHYHGIVVLNGTELTRMFKHGIHKLKHIGHVDFKELETFKDNLRWVLYMSKEAGFTCDVLDINGPIMKVEKKCQKRTADVKHELDYGIMQYLIPVEETIYYNEDD